MGRWYDGEVWLGLYIGSGRNRMLTALKLSSIIGASLSEPHTRELVLKNLQELARACMYVCIHLISCKTHTLRVVYPAFSYSILHLMWNPLLLPLFNWSHEDFTYNPISSKARGKVPWEKGQQWIPPSPLLPFFP